MEMVWRNYPETEQINAQEIQNPSLNNSKSTYSVKALNWTTMLPLVVLVLTLMLIPLLSSVWEKRWDKGVAPNVL